VVVAAQRAREVAKLASHSEGERGRTPARIKGRRTVNQNFGNTGEQEGLIMGQTITEKNPLPRHGAACLGGGRLFILNQT